MSYTRKFNIREEKNAGELLVNHLLIRCTNPADRATSIQRVLKQEDGNNTLMLAIICANNMLLAYDVESKKKATQIAKLNHTLQSGAAARMSDSERKSENDKLRKLRNAHQTLTNEMNTVTELLAALEKHSLANYSINGNYPRY